MPLEQVTAGHTLESGSSWTPEISRSSQYSFGSSSGKKMAIWFIALLQRTAGMKLAILRKTSSRLLGKSKQFF